MVKEYGTYKVPKISSTREAIPLLILLAYIIFSYYILLYTNNPELTLVVMIAGGVLTAIVVLYLRLYFIYSDLCEWVQTNVKCPKCGGRMARCRFYTRGMYLINSYKVKSGLPDPNPPRFYLQCGNCRNEFILADPSNTWSFVLRDRSAPDRFGMHYY